METKIFRSLKWDRDIEKYHEGILSEVVSKDLLIKANQFYVFYDLYRRQKVSVHPNAEQIVGMKAELFDFSTQSILLIETIFVPLV